jgi:hypothetical protein
MSWARVERAKFEIRDKVLQFNCKLCKKLTGRQRYAHLRLCSKKCLNLALALANKDSETKSKNPQSRSEVTSLINKIPVNTQPVAPFQCKMCGGTKKVGHEHITSRGFCRAKCFTQWKIKQSTC